MAFPGGESLLLRTEGCGIGKFIKIPSLSDQLEGVKRNIKQKGLFAGGLDVGGGRRAGFDAMRERHAEEAAAEERAIVDYDVLTEMLLTHPESFEIRRPKPDGSAKWDTYRGQDISAFVSHEQGHRHAHEVHDTNGKLIYRVYAIDAAGACFAGLMGEVTGRQR